MLVQRALFLVGSWQMISTTNSSQARCICEKLQRLGPPKIPALSTYSVLNSPSVSMMQRMTLKQPAVVSDGKNSAWISLVASSTTAIRQDFFFPNQRCVLPSICNISPGASIRSLLLCTRLRLRLAQANAT